MTDHDERIARRIKKLRSSNFSMGGAGPNVVAYCWTAPEADSCCKTGSDPFQWNRWQGQHSGRAEPLMSRAIWSPGWNG